MTAKRCARHVADSSGELCRPHSHERTYDSSWCRISGTVCWPLGGRWASETAMKSVKISKLRLVVLWRLNQQMTLMVVSFQVIFYR